MELHDHCDDPDYAASQRQDSAVNISLDSNQVSDPSELEVVYSKENVAIHPSQYASKRIIGRLRIIKQSSSLFLTWIPNRAESKLVDSAGKSSSSIVSDKDNNVYSIKSVPLSDIHSIRRHIPTLGWQYIVVSLSSGLALPPLYFYTGGVRDFLAILKQHIFIVRSADDANVFWLNGFQKNTSPLELPSVAVGETLHQSLSTSSHGTSTPSKYRERKRNKVFDPAHDLSIHVLEKFSLVTKLAREATTQLFREIQDNHATLGDKKLRTNPLSATIVSQKSCRPNNERTKADDIEGPSSDFKCGKSFVRGKQNKPPLNNEEWRSFLDCEGRVMDSKSLKKIIFYSGVESGLRKEVWRFLLGYYEYDSTFAEREYLDSVKKSEYEKLKFQWKSISELQARRFTKFRERKGLIEKDVGMSDLLSPILFVMRDESVSFWSFVALMERLGSNFNRDQNGIHTQLFALMKLVELLDHPLHDYFARADCLNYFFCFRWILIQFKREFGYKEVMQLWEVLWTHHLSEHFHLYISVAILKTHREKIMGEEMDFDSLLKFINGLSGEINLDEVLSMAEALCISAGEHGAACIPPGTPPSLPIQSDSQEFEQVL